MSNLKKHAEKLKEECKTWTERQRRLTYAQVCPKCGSKEHINRGHGSCQEKQTR